MICFISTALTIGWLGIVFLARNAAIVYRSPLRALDDTKYCAYLQKDLWCTSAMVHIRLATVGVMSSINCHPFRHVDYSGRIWTFMHNGTAFQDSMLEPYKHLCKGDTDSEAVFILFLMQLIKRLKKRTSADKRRAYSDYRRKNYAFGARQ